VTREDLIADIQKLGYSIRESREVLNTVLDIIKARLAKGSKVSLPIGDLSVVPGPKERRMWRLDKIVTQYKNPKRIKFKPKEDLDLEE
jgi:nucleoid DNA-binding protein